MTLVALQHSVKTILRNGRGSLSQVRYHHPDPFSPKMTKGWKAALKVGQSTKAKTKTNSYSILSTIHLFFCSFSPGSRNSYDQGGPRNCPLSRDGITRGK